MKRDKRMTWETYARAWKETSPEGKASALEQSVSPGCLYKDPTTVAKGHTELIDYMLAFHRQNPGGHFVTTYFLAHHDASIAKWNMIDGNDVVVGDGLSYGQYDEHGELFAMTGFFEVPAQ